MDISIITVNYNGKDKILDQIESVIHGAVGLEFEQFVSDNGSIDDSLEIIRSKFPRVKVIENKKNIGFGPANNRAADLARGEFLLFLNPDMRVEAGSLKKMVDWMRSHPEAGIASCKLINEAGSFNEDAKPRRFPGLFDQVALLLKIPHVLPSILDRYMYKGFDSDIEQEVDSVRGSFMLMRREIFEKLGWAFDPRYFFWFEDVDICRETRRLGYKIFYTPIISCVDYVGQTFKKQPNLIKQRWFTESMVKYFKKWEPWWKWMIIAVVAPIGICLVRLRGILKI